MEKIGIFFGSDTGNTENIAKMIQAHLNHYMLEIYDIAQSTKVEVEKFNTLLLGCPTWYYGEVQCDWDDFLPSLAKIDFSKKKVALFGCGDQEDYAEYFCDALGIIADIILATNGKIIGKWPIDNYFFEASKALCKENPNYFVGLALDEDRQPELTESRVEKWTKQLCLEL